MNWSTKLFLILLQMAIGWHFLYEGMWKIQEKKWSSKPYLQAANGPTAAAMRWSAGDPAVKRDGAEFTVEAPTIVVKEYFAFKPIDKNLAPADRRLHQHMPPLLEKEWDAYFQSFLEAYGLDKAPAPSEADFEKLQPEYIAVLGYDPLTGSIAAIPWGALQLSYVPQAGQYDNEHPPEPRAQRALAERLFRDFKAHTVAWLSSGKKKVKRPYLAGPAGEATVSIPQRVEEFVAADTRANELEAGKTSMFGHKGTPELKRTRDDATALRAELLADIRDQTNAMKAGLRDVLSPEQKRMALPKDSTEKPADWTRMKTVDTYVRYGLVAIGLLLLLGLFTRIACVVGALLLLSFYLAMPAFPWLPDPAMSEGHYLFVNKNIIEMLALLALATSHPGRRYGLDMWVRMLWNTVNPWRRKTQTVRGKTPEYRTVAVSVPADAPPPRGVPVTTETSTRSDSSHAS